MIIEFTVERQEAGKELDMFTSSMFPGFIKREGNIPAIEVVQNFEVMG